MKRANKGAPHVHTADGLSRGEVEFLHDEGQMDTERYHALIEQFEDQERRAAERAAGWPDPDSIYDPGWRPF